MRIMRLLIEQNNAQDAILMAATLRDKREVNPNAWLRGVIGASVFRQDMQGKIFTSILRKTSAISL